MAAGLDREASGRLEGKSGKRDREGKRDLLDN